MKIDIEGFDKLKKNLDDIKSNINENYEQKVDIVELLSPDFMQKHSQFSNFDEMVELSEFDEESFDEDFDEITASDEWNDYVTDRTKFKDWEEMMNIAGIELISSKLGFVN